METVHLVCDTIIKDESNCYNVSSNKSHFFGLGVSSPWEWQCDFDKSLMHAWQLPNIRTIEPDWPIRKLDSGWIMMKRVLADLSEILVFWRKTRTTPFSNVVPFNPPSYKMAPGLPQPGLGEKIDPIEPFYSVGWAARGVVIVNFYPSASSDILNVSSNRKKKNPCCFLVQIWNFSCASSNYGITANRVSNFGFRSRSAGLRGFIFFAPCSKWRVGLCSLLIW